MGKSESCSISINYRWWVFGPFAFRKHIAPGRRWKSSDHLKNTYSESWAAVTAILLCAPFCWLPSTRLCIIYQENTSKLTTQKKSKCSKFWTIIYNSWWMEHIKRFIYLISFGYFQRKTHRKRGLLKFLPKAKLFHKQLMV